MITIQCAGASGAGDPPPPIVLRSSWVVVLAEYPDATSLHSALATALRRGPEGRIAAADCRPEQY